MKSESWIACSPDGSASISPLKIGQDSNETALAKIEIKNNMEASSLARSMPK